MSTAWAWWAIMPVMNCASAATKAGRVVSGLACAAREGATRTVATSTARAVCDSVSVTRGSLDRVRQGVPSAATVGRVARRVPKLTVRPGPDRPEPGGTRPAGPPGRGGRSGRSPFARYVGGSGRAGPALLHGRVRAPEGFGTGPPVRQPPTKLAVSVMGTLASALDTMQFTLASSATFWNSAADSPGTSPRVVEVDSGDAEPLADLVEVDGGGGLDASRRMSRPSSARRKWPW